MIVFSNVALINVSVSGSKKLREVKKHIALDIYEDLAPCELFHEKRA